MKKINLLAVVVAGVFAVACNGGGSSNNSGGGGGSTSDACANGAATCGALSSAESVEKVIPLNALPVVGLTALTGANEPIIKSTTNLYLSNQESAFVTFSIESNGVTQPFIMDFNIRAKFETTVLPKFVATTSAGQNANQCKFPADVNGSYICTLTISPNNAPAGAYEIIGTIVGGNQPFEINVVTNYQEPTSFTLPLGTYQDNSIFVARDENLAPMFGSCPSPHYISAAETWPQTMVITSQGTFMCSSMLGGYCRGSYPNQPIPIPSRSTSSGIMFNGMWNKNTYSSNYVYFDDACYGSGLIPTFIFTYQNSSQTLPFPVRDPYAMNAAKIINSFAQVSQEHELFLGNN